MLRELIRALIHSCHSHDLAAGAGTPATSLRTASQNARTRAFTGWVRVPSTL